LEIAGLRGKYDGVFGLGLLCFTAIQLERNNLRSYSGVLDWMGSPILPDVSRLIRNRFEGFFDRDQLAYMGNASDKFYLIQDTQYNLYSNHDFAIDHNSPEGLETYPAVKAKFDRRIERMLDKVAKGKRLLFVRNGGTYEEFAELGEALAGLVANDFRLLAVQETEVTKVTPREWALERVCGIEIPKLESPFDPRYDDYWKEMLDGIEIID